MMAVYATCECGRQCRKGSVKCWQCRYPGGSARRLVCPDCGEYKAYSSKRCLRCSMKLRRKPGDHKRRTSVYMTVGALEALDGLARVWGMSQSAVVMRLVQTAWKRTQEEVA